MAGGLLMQLIQGRPATLNGPSPYDEQRQMNAPQPNWAPRSYQSYHDPSGLLNSMGLPNSLERDQLEQYPLGISAIIQALMRGQR